MSAQIKNRYLITFLSIMRIAVLSYWTYWLYTYILPVLDTNMIDPWGYYLLTLLPSALVLLDLIFSASLYKFESISWILLLLLDIAVILYSMDWVLGYIGASAIFHIALIVISVLQLIVLLLSRIHQE